MMRTLHSDPGKMKILHVTQSLMLDSGVSVFVGELANAQAQAGHGADVACSCRPEYSTGEAGCSVRLDFTDGIDADIVHLHGLWDLYGRRALRQCRRQGIPYVVSPHGGLMPRVFQKGRLKKWIFWHLVLKPQLKRAAAIHCTSEAEAQACAALGLRGPFVVAPLGVRLPEIAGERACDCKTALFLGRLGEEKGLVKLLDAWKLLMDEFSNWQLLIAGPDWRGQKALLGAKISAEGIQRVVFTGNADAVMKDKLYRQADLFLLPSPMENFSMVVLEALAYGVPAIATKGTPWSELEGGVHCPPPPSTSTLTCVAGKCGWWIDQGVAPLEAAMRQAMSLTDSERREMGKRGRQLAERKYQWPKIAADLVKCYREIV